GEHAIGACGRSSIRKFLEAHLQNRIEITEEHERDIRVKAQPPNEIENAGKCGPGAQRTVASAVNGGAVGNGIAERHAKLDDVCARFSRGAKNFLSGI